MQSTICACLSVPSSQSYCDAPSSPDHFPLLFILHYTCPFHPLGQYRSASCAQPLQVTSIRTNQVISSNGEFELVLPYTRCYTSICCPVVPVPRHSQSQSVSDHLSLPMSLPARTHPTPVSASVFHRSVKSAPDVSWSAPVHKSHCQLDVHYLFIVRISLRISFWTSFIISHHLHHLRAFYELARSHTHKRSDQADSLARTRTLLTAPIVHRSPASTICLFVICFVHTSPSPAPCTNAEAVLCLFATN